MADKNKDKAKWLIRRKFSIRKSVFGSEQRPRLSVYRSSKHIYAQIINDMDGKTLVSASSTQTDVRGDLKTGANLRAASAVGKAIAEKALAAGIKLVCFDRGGRRYHGRIKALADAAREGGLSF